MSNDSRSEFTQEEVNEANLQEENMRLQAQTQYLMTRVVTLRALVNRLQTQDETPDKNVDEEQ